MYARVYTYTFTRIRIRTHTRINLPCTFSRHIRDVCATYTDMRMRVYTYVYMCIRTALAGRVANADIVAYFGSPPFGPKPGPLTPRLQPHCPAQQQSTANSDNEDRKVHDTNDISSEGWGTNVGNMDLPLCSNSGNVAARRCCSAFPLLHTGRNVQVTCNLRP